MAAESIERLFFKATQRVIAAEKELKLATAEYHRIYDIIAGIGPTGHGAGVPTPAGNESSIHSVGDGSSMVPSTLVNDGPRQTVRIRVKQYCCQNSGRCLSAETIARALGTKITTTRY